MGRLCSYFRGKENHNLQFWDHRYVANQDYFKKCLISTETSISRRDLVRCQNLLKLWWVEGGCWIYDFSAWSDWQVRLEFRSDQQRWNHWDSYTTLASNMLTDQSWSLTFSPFRAFQNKKIPKPILITCYLLSI